MKFLTLALLAVGLMVAEDREGNFDIRFEPTAKLQTQVEVPFEIHIVDARKQPLVDAQIQVRIALEDGSHPASLPGKRIAAGVYVAKPTFPVPGRWNVETTARRNDLVTTRMIVFTVVP